MPTPKEQELKEQQAELTQLEIELTQQELELASLRAKLQLKRLAYQTNINEYTVQLLNISKQQQESLEKLEQDQKDGISAITRQIEELAQTQREILAALTERIERAIEGIEFLTQGVESQQGNNQLIFSPIEPLQGTVDNQQKIPKSWELIYVLERDLYRIHSLTFNVDNQILIKTAGGFKLWNHKTREFTQDFSQDFNDLSSIFYRVVVLSPDGQAVAAFNQQNETIELWNVKTNQIIQILAEQPRTVSLAFSLDDHLLAIGNQYGNVRLWNFKNGTIIQTLCAKEGSSSEYNSIESMVFHPNSLVLAISPKNSIIKFWDLETGELMENVIRHDPPKSIAFSPDGQSLAIGSRQGSLIKLWDWKRKELIQTFEGHSEGVNSITFSPDSQTLAVGCCDGTVKLWNWQTGELIQTLEIPKLQGYLKKEKVNNVAFSPDGQTLAIGSTKLDNSTRTGTIQIWAGSADPATSF